VGGGGKNSLISEKEKEQKRAAGCIKEKGGVNSRVKRRDGKPRLRGFLKGARRSKEKNEGKKKRIEN